MNGNWSSGQKTREPKLLDRFFLFQKIWKDLRLSSGCFLNYGPPIAGNLSLHFIFQMSPKLQKSWYGVLEKEFGSQNYSIDSFYSKSFGKNSGSAREVFWIMVLRSWDHYVSLHFRSCSNFINFVLIARFQRWIVTRALGNARELNKHQWEIMLVPSGMNL